MPIESAASQEPRTCAFGCPVEATLEVVGGRWKAVILFRLMEGTKRFGELRRQLPQATQRMLTLQLRQLEEDGVIHRHVYAQVPPKVEYSLTEFGRTLEPVLKAMLEWGRAYESRMEKEVPRPSTGGGGAGD